MKRLDFMIIPALICGLLLTSCGSDKSETEPISRLQGTKWKLEGIVDIQTSTLKELEPKNCDKCYTFVFDTDTTARGYTCVNAMYIGGLNPIVIGGTKIYETGDAGICFDALFSVKSYTFDGKELKLFFDNNNNYLLYKPF